MSVSVETELRVLRNIIKEDILKERIATLTVDAPRILGKVASVHGITAEEAGEIFRPIVAELIEEAKQNFDIK